jgi:predicted esterase
LLHALTFLQRELGCDAIRARGQVPVPELCIGLQDWAHEAADVLSFDRLFASLRSEGDVRLVLWSRDWLDSSAHALELLTRYQRLLPLSPDLETMPWLGQILAAHQLLHGLAEQQSRGSYEHSLDTWRWLLRLDPEAEPACQLAALFHEVGTNEAKRALGPLSLDPRELERMTELLGRRELNAYRERKVLDDAQALSFFSLCTWRVLREQGVEETRRKLTRVVCGMSDVALCLALMTVALLVLAPTAHAERVHVVASGHTLGKIAKRYNVTIQAICHANDIDKNKPIRPGQKLIIPEKSDKTGDKARRENLAKAAPSPEKEPPPRRGGADPAGMQTLEVPGVGTAYYYAPTGPGRLALRPVMMYLHGRGGHAKRDCQRWAPVVRRLGWLVCPSGPGARGQGRGWNNSWYTAHQAVMKSLSALRDRYGRRVQLYGNTLIGFSEGAYAAMNVGVREPRAFNRWLILAANSNYWGPLGKQHLDSARARVRKVYLITGERDAVVEGTRQVREALRKAKISTRISTPKGLGHELKLDGEQRWLYHSALVWLNKG